MIVQKKQIKTLLILLIALIISNFYPTNQNKSENNIYVSRVIDGDTIELSTGQKLRYIGVDTPELNFNKNPECFAKESTEFNKKLVENKKVELEKDISDKDKYGRLLRNVYVQNESSSSAIFVNEYLVQQGFATVSTYPPDIAHIEELLIAQQEARENNRGLWGKCN
ncbi:MAG: thermonuclease family protein [bacterium]